ncbi:MAG: hypothetical protein ABW128_06245, partial [Rhizorhabdus sp.]
MTINSQATGSTRSTSFGATVAFPRRSRLRSPHALASIVALLATTSFGTAAHAAVVGVCTGVSLPRSVVTDLTGAVLVPIVGSLETNLEALTGALPILGPLIDVDLGLTDAVTAASAGAPITLNVLDINGNAVNVLADPECVSQADAYELEDPAGIAIGGNRITGLGTVGRLANAAEPNAIAFGDAANTGAGATGAVAIGDSASVTATGALGSVALGQNSLATGATLATPAYLTGGTAPAEVNIGGRRLSGLAAGAVASDAVTVGQLQLATAGLTADALPFNAVLGDYDANRGGAPTNITGVAPGALTAASTEAVNGAQLFATNQNVTGNTTAITNLTTNIANGTADPLAVRYADPTRTLLTLAGAGGTRVTNVTPGALNAASTDAVNGSQLFATNQNVAGLAADALLFSPALNAYNATRGGAPTRITGVAPGALTAASTDAVNGSQLFATNQQVAGNTTAITNLTNNIANGTADPLAVRYTDATRTTLALAGAGGTRVTTVTAGAVNAASTDAVNGSQLNATNQTVNNLGTSVATSLGGGSVVNADGSVSAPAYTLTNVGAGGATTTTTYNNVGSALAGLGSSITNVNNRIAAASDRAVTYDGAVGAPRDTITLAGTAGTRITNLTAGAVNATSTDAVNGAQLNAVGQQVAANTTNIANNTTNITALQNGSAGFFRTNNTAGSPAPVVTGTNSVAGGGGA